MNGSDDALRRALAGQRGPELWRSLDEWADTEAFRSHLQAEFPSVLDTASIDRRALLKVMGASLALGGLGGCSPPAEQIVPYVRSQDQTSTGKPKYYASAMVFDGAAKGVLVESNMGRPTKIEGNPNHPASRGATDIFAQASVLELWDPDRSQVTMHGADVSPWRAFREAVEDATVRLEQNAGAGLRILTGPICSPTLRAQLEELLTQYPEARWHVHDPVGRDNAVEGSRLAFGAPVESCYQLEHSDLILSLDADFLGPGPAQLRYARALGNRRTSALRAGTTVRLYAVGPTPTLTRAAADHNVPLRGGAVEHFARRVAVLLGLDAPPPPALDARLERLAAAVAADCERHRGRVAVLAGRSQPPAVHVIAHALNDAVGTPGTTVTYAAPTQPAEIPASLSMLVEDIESGGVDTLLIAGANPVASAPVDLGFRAALTKVPVTIHHGLFRDETALASKWHVPQLHYLEDWGDARAEDGTVTLIQPLIAPLYDGHSLHELLAMLGGSEATSTRERVRNFWRDRHAGDDFEHFFDSALESGTIPGSGYESYVPALDPSAIAATPVGALPAEKTLEIVFAPDPTVWDGRFANNGWLQELPKPLTSLTWDNAALLSPATAARLGLRNEDVVTLDYAGRTVEAPVWILPGHAEESVTVHLGYGRKAAGRIGSDLGFDAYKLRASHALWFDHGLRLHPTGRRTSLATTQNHHAMHGRAPVRSAKLQDYQQHPGLFATPENPSLYPERHDDGYAWGMAIDLNRCIGCNACTIACQAENNIPVVGKEQVAIGREMHWIRVDAYFQGVPANPAVHFQPVPCMHCAHAPCEIVCPVGATLHDQDGLNLQVYNRCIGTRFCSNNCPYKVRRFNFLRYADQTTQSLRAQRNPEVTVRNRGVMEKCTYCIQRISTAKIAAEERGTPLADGEVVTACQAVCPAEAIVFGNINDRDSGVSAAKASPRNYALLDEQNTRPRTTYLARITSPNTEIDP